MNQYSEYEYGGFLIKGPIAPYGRFEVWDNLGLLGGGKMPWLCATAEQAEQTIDRWSERFE
jgi:hypothetical protein